MIKLPEIKVIESLQEADKVAEKYLAILQRDEELYSETQHQIDLEHALLTELYGSDETKLRTPEDLIVMGTRFYYCMNLLKTQGEVSVHEWHRLYPTLLSKLFLDNYDENIDGLTFTRFYDAVNTAGVLRAGRMEDVLLQTLISDYFRELRIKEDKGKNSCSAMYIDSITSKIYRTDRHATLFSIDLNDDLSKAGLVFTEAMIKYEWMREDQRSKRGSSDVWLNIGALLNSPVRD